MPTERVIRIALPYLLCIVLFFIGLNVGKRTKVAQISEYQSKITIDSLTFVIEKKEYEIKLEQIHRDLAVRQSKIDTAGVVYIDSLWQSYGF
jgi:ribosomal protein L24